MGSNPEYLERVSRSPAALANYIIGSVISTYHRWHPNEPDGAFEEVIKLLFFDENTCGDEWLESHQKYYSNSTEKWPMHAPPIDPLDYFLLVVSAYCAEGVFNEMDGNIGKAWALIAEANLFFGVTSGMYEAVKAMSESAKEKNRYGGKARSAKYDPMRNLVEDLAQQHSYQSRRNAAIRMKPAVLKLAEELGVPMSEDQAVSTIQGWLRERGISFASKRATPSSKNSTSSN